MLHKQFALWNYNNCSVAPLTDYTNNLIHQELPMEGDYFTDATKSLYWFKRQWSVHWQ